MLSPDTNTPPSPAGRWLAIVGIGEDGLEGLSGQARDLLQTAAIVFGGARHLSLAAPLIHGTAQPWERGIPFEDSVKAVLAHRGHSVCVLASGDPFQYGVGAALARHVSSDEVLALPALSAFCLAASRLLWSLPHTTLLSLCGRSLDLLRPHLQPGGHILALTSDAAAPAAIARLLCATGFGASRMTVLEALGGSRERIRATSANRFDLEPAALNTLAIEVTAAADARVVPRAPGLSDELFEHDGQLTKREVRAMTLSALAPRRGERLWDIGAGSGSVAIEWMLADISLSAIAIERRADRAARIRRNASALGVPDLQVLESSAPGALEGLDPPHAVFVGGGATNAGLLEAAQAALRPNGRLVINAVTLQTEAVLVNMHARYGGTLTRVEISRAAPVGGESGRMTGWRPAMPVTQWTWVKP
jgi:precorrin-6B C5,15-methyltransferase / cobalt-precorrin-6B C5,C15-methyltransferase